MAQASQLASPERLAATSPGLPRIAYVVSLFPCWSETFITEEIDKLVGSGVDVRIFSLKPACEPLVHPLAEKHLERVVYASFSKVLGTQVAALFYSPRTYLRQLYRCCTASGLTELRKQVAAFLLGVYFAREAARAGVSHVHAHWATYPATAAWTIDALTGIPYSVTTHAHDLFLRDALLPKKLNQAKFVVTISEYNRRLLRKLCGDRVPIHVVHCGVDTDLFQPVRNYNWEGRRIIAVGRLAEIKGFPTLIEACKLLRNRGVDFSCEIIGDGPLRSALDESIVAAGLRDRVQLSGLASQETVRDKLRESAMFVLPSRTTPDGDQDGIPVALMEAMSMAVPVISTRVSGIPELVKDGHTGLLVEPENAAQLADAMAALLSSRETCVRIGSAGRKTVSAEFDVRRNASRLRELFGTGS